MYRQRAEETVEVERAFFVSRLLHIPMVATAMDQVNAIYKTTKDRNNLIKRTMERAETGVSAVIGTATAPVIYVFDRPLTSLNDFACVQLDKLENRYPIITKPTDEVVKATKDLCNTAVKPIVDRMSSAKQFGFDKVSNVRSFTGEKLDDVRSYGWTKVESVVQMGNDGMSRVMTTVGSDYGLTKVDDFLDVADRYIDNYLPQDDQDDKVESKENNEEKMRADGKSPSSSSVVVSKAFQLGSKVQKRLWSRTMKQMKDVQLRSAETIQKLNFTVDLIEFARTNFNDAKDKVETIWTEVNKTEEEIARQEMDLKEKTTEEMEKRKNGFERRAIATARQLTLSLKSTLSWLHIPQFVGGVSDVANRQIRSVQQKTQALANIFSEEVVYGKDLAESGLGTARNLTSQIYSELIGLVSSVIQYGVVKKELVVREAEKLEEKFQEKFEENSEEKSDEKFEENSEEKFEEKSDEKFEEKSDENLERDSTKEEKNDGQQSNSSSSQEDN